MRSETDKHCQSHGPTSIFATPLNPFRFEPWSRRIETTFEGSVPIRRLSESTAGCGSGPPSTRETSLRLSSGRWHLTGTNRSRSGFTVHSRQLPGSPIGLRFRRQPRNYDITRVAGAGSTDWPSSPNLPIWLWPVTVPARPIGSRKQSNWEQAGTQLDVTLLRATFAKLVGQDHPAARLAAEDAHEWIMSSGAVLLLDLLADGLPSTRVADAASG